MAWIFRPTIRTCALLGPCALLVAAVGVRSLSSPASSSGDPRAPSERLPADMWVLPEELPPEQARALERQARRAPERLQLAFLGGFDRILERTGEGLDSFEGGERGGGRLFPRWPFPRARQPAPEGAAGGWELSQLIVSLSVSAQGLLGVLLTSGSTFTSITWGRRPMPEARLAAAATTRGESTRARAETGSAASDLRLEAGPDVSDVDLEDRTRRLARAVVATGRVRSSEGLLARELRRAAFDFRSLARPLASLRGDVWTPVTFEFYLTISASGMVLPAVSVGGGVTVILAWKPPRSPASAQVASEAGLGTRPRPPAAGPLSGAQRALAELTRTLIEDMKAAVPSAPAAVGTLTLRQIQIQLGTTASANIGIAQAGYSRSAEMTFERAPARAGTAFAPAPMGAPYVAALASYPLLTGHVDDRFVAYARERGSERTTETVAGLRPTEDGSRGGLFALSRTAFRAGLQRATALGALFVSRLQEGEARHPERRWEVTEMNPQFTLSLGGTAVIASLQRTGAVGLIYDKPSRP